MQQSLENIKKGIGSKLNTNWSFYQNYKNKAINDLLGWQQQIANTHCIQGHDKLN